MSALIILRNRYRRLHQEAAICSRACGPLALLAISANLLTGRPQCLALQSRELKHPLFLRLHTSDAATYRDTFTEQEYDFPLSFEPYSIVDVGANCGMTAVFYANRYPQARIIALEPEPSNFAALKKNVAQYPKITPMQGAL
jgi:hypothetical protein